MIEAQMAMVEANRSLMRSSASLALARRISPMEGLYSEQKAKMSTTASPWQTFTMRFPDTVDFGYARQMILLVLANEPTEIARMEAEVGHTQAEAVSFYVSGSYELAHVRQAGFDVQRESLRHELRRMSPLVWRLIFD